MSQKNSRKSRKHVEEATPKETEKTPEVEFLESETHENGTKENEETINEPNESKETIKDTKENGTEVPSEEPEQPDIIKTEERKEVEENVDVLPETNEEPTVLISDSEEPLELNLQVEEAVPTESECEKIEVNEEVATSEANDEYLLAKEEINGEDVDDYVNGEPEYENSVDNDDVSTEVVVGNDTTRNIDFTLPPDSSMERSKFLNMSKDHSVGESIKFLSSRRSIRSIRNHFPIDGINTYTLQKTESTGHKRKYCDDTDETAKRIKTDSTGLLSYIANPFAKNAVSSSTPKLTGFKSNNFDNTNMSKISLNDTEKGQNKWCSVM